MERNHYAVFIGRFQPPHQTHIQIIKQALAESEKLILVIGSAKSAPNIKNPFTFDERDRMIRACLTSEENGRLVSVPIRDYHYNELAWITEIQQSVAEIAGDDPDVSLYGTYKDSSSYYVKLFPQWRFVATRVASDDNSTSIRSALFEDPTPRAQWDDKSVNWQRMGVPAPVAKKIMSRVEADPEWFNSLRADYDYVKAYKAAWDKAPFKPVFVTVDAVVTMSGHVLVVRRKSHPGKGLLALPGGFVKQDERLEDAAIRELREETRVPMDNESLRRTVAKSRVFDYPGRSLRGRTITHAFHFDLGSGPLPPVKGGDDAARAMWMPMADVLQKEGEFFEDHWHIAYFFFQA